MNFKAINLPKCSDLYDELLKVEAMLKSIDNSSGEGLMINVRDVNYSINIRNSDIIKHTLSEARERLVKELESYGVHT